MAAEPDDNGKPDNDTPEPMSRWEFLDAIPTVEKVLALLETVPDVYGVRVVDYAEHVVPLSQNKKVKVKQPARAGGKPIAVEKYFEVWTLYMSVAGRVAMLNAAQEAHGWRVDFEPDQGANRLAMPGLAEIEDRLVYREYVTIFKADGELLGRRPGMAQVKSKGGMGAAGSNPQEKVETSARGRAIAAWGFGVLPGSGIASLEEMYGVQRENRAEPEAASPPKEIQSKPELIEDTRTKMEEVRQARNLEPAEMTAKVAKYVTDSFGVSIGNGDGDGAGGLSFDKLKMPQLRLVRNSLADTLKAIAAERAPL